MASCVRVAGKFWLITTKARKLKKQANRLLPYQFRSLKTGGEIPKVKI